MKANKNIKGFIWDKGNIDKNLIKHDVSNSECEEAFFDDHKLIFNDIIHSKKEKRYIILARTKNERLLFMVYIIRNQMVRIISARDVSKRERRLYEERT